MKRLFFIINILFAYEVEFIKEFKKEILPSKEAIKIITNAKLKFPFKFYKVKDGYILTGDLREIEYWLENEFYAPKDAKFKKIKYAKVDYDEIQLEIIKKLKKIYKNCNLKKVVFLTENREEIVTTPTIIKDKFKIVLECK